MSIYLSNESLLVIAVVGVVAGWLGKSWMAAALVSSGTWP
jgi:hypothetical protein